MLKRVLLGDKVTGHSHRFNHIHCQGFAINSKTSDDMFNHPDKFAVQNQLGIIEGDTTFKHSRTINQIGTCQCWNESGERLFVAHLAVGYL